MPVAPLKSIRALGFALLPLGLAFNPWLVGALVSPDGRMESLANRLVVFALEALILGGGAALLLWPDWFRRRWPQLLLALGSTLFGLLLVEGGARLAIAVKYRFFPPDRSRSSYYGWVTEANITRTAGQPGYGAAHYSTGPHGFRHWGDPAAPRRKLLVLGDSYTQACAVSDGEAYYDRIARESPNVELFAYGCGGYSSLQEYMILDAFFDQIRPDLILWQFCSNDLVENSPELEALSYFNARMRRPYLCGGKIEWRVPATHFGFFYDLAQSSYVLRLICNLQTEALNARRQYWLEKDFTRERPLCEAAAETTRQIMAMARRRAGKTPIVAFSSTEAPWVGDAYARACAAAGIDYLPGVAAAVEAEKKKGVVVDGMPVDAHWNANGHAIAGKMLLEHLRKNYAACLK